MNKKSKKENILELFFNEPSKEWHFTEITKKADISKQQCNKWLKRFRKEKLIIHENPKGKMPYFKANFKGSNYKNKKRIYALEKLYRTGFLEHLEKLDKAKTIIIFGSFARSDWYKDSDIDLFIYGSAKGLKTGKYWRKLHRSIQPHIFKNKKEIRKIRSGLIKNVMDGFLVKGSMNELIGVKI